MSLAVCHISYCQSHRITKNANNTSDTFEIAGNWHDIFWGASVLVSWHSQSHCCQICKYSSIFKGFFSLMHCNKSTSTYSEPLRMYSLLIQTGIMLKLYSNHPVDILLLPWLNRMCFPYHYVREVPNSSTPTPLMVKFILNIFKLKINWSLIIN